MSMVQFNSNLSHNLSHSTTTINMANVEESIQFLEDVVVINQNYPKSSFNIAMFSVIVSLVIVVNLLVLMWVKVKEKVLVDKMVTMDCVANIMMVGLLFLAFPCRVWRNSFLCAVITFYRAFTITINRWVQQSRT